MTGLDRPRLAAAAPICRQDGSGDDALGPAHRDWLLAALVSCVALAAYAATLCPSVYVEGSGELIGATCLLGTPHPTGYPLYVLLGRLACALLPFASAAREVNAATAAMSAAAAAGLYILLRSRGCARVAAAAAGLAFAGSRTFWSQAVIAEVYGLFALAAVVAVGVSLRARRGADRERWLLLAGYVAGLAATCHLQALLLLPWALAAAAWGQSAGRDWRRRAGAALRLAGGFAAGLSVVLYLVLRNGVGPGFHWGFLDSPAALWDHLTGALYRPAFIWLPLPALQANLMRLWGQLAAEGTPLLLPLVAWGTVVACRRDRPLAFVAVGAATLNAATALSYHRDPAGLDVFFLLAILCGAILLGLGLDDVERRLRPRLGAVSASVLIVAIGTAVGAANARAVDRSDAWLPDRYGRRLLAELPPDAILLTEGDDASYILDYLHRVEGVRPDVALYNRTGRGSDLAGSVPEPQRPYVRLRREGELLATGRAVHFLAPHKRPGLRLVPWGLSYRVVTAGDSGLEPPPEATSAELAQLDGAGRDPWVQKLAANRWFMLGESRREAGLKGAAEAYVEAARAAPSSQTTNYNVALMLLRMNELERSSSYAMKAVAIDPVRPGPYLLAEQILERLGRREALQDLHKRAREWTRSP